MFCGCDEYIEPEFVQGERFRPQYRDVNEPEGVEKISGESTHVLPVLDENGNLDLHNSRVYEKSPEGWREITGGTLRGEMLRKYRSMKSQEMAA